jgi:prepilin-type N-terminal cleavage/methylation domain-containing protein
MKRSKKLDSFTLAEMMVVLALAAILISIAMVVLKLVQREMLGITKYMNENTEIQHFERALWYDMNQGTVEFNPENAKLMAYTAIDTTVYTFEKEYTIRNNDTLKIFVKDYQGFIDGDTTKGKFIDAIALSITKGGQPRELFIYTHKAASYYMNNQ